MSVSNNLITSMEKKYKLWQLDPNIPIPLRTIQRLENRINSNSSLLEKDIEKLSNLYNEKELRNRQTTGRNASSSFENDLDTSRSLNGDGINELSTILYKDSISESSRNFNGDGNEILMNLHEDSINETSKNSHTDRINQDNQSESSVIASNRAHDEVFLYDKSSMTLDNFVTSLLNIYVQNKWTKTSLQKLLSLLGLMLPEGNLMPETIFKIFQYVENSTKAFTTIKHFYCKQCLSYNSTDSNLRNCFSCHADKTKISYFFEIDIYEQIKYMFEHRQLAEKLKTLSFVRDENIIADITDGSEYLRVNSRANRQKYDLTLILNTDGLALVKSSKSHCWPLMFLIAELPDHLRESFLVIIGLWYDTETKPSMNTYLQPFYLKLKKCFDDGITWINPKTKEKTVTTVVAPLIIADAPVRAQLQNVSYFNGMHGCNTCEIRMEKAENIPGKRTSRIYPFYENNARLRSGSRMKIQATKFAQRRNDHVTNIRGVKGESILSKFPLLDLGTCVIPEYMHCALLGVGKQFLNLLINKKGAWNIKKHLKVIDDFISNIRPPHFFNRMPRKLSNFNLYKASEYYNWILFYSIPTLHDFLPKKYFQHWILFVKALFTLLQDSIQTDELEAADLWLRQFVKDTQVLYGDREMTYNIHQLTHLVLIVKRWGPLWATSAFPFENCNGFLANSVHGAKNLAEEMMKNLKIAQGLHSMGDVNNKNTNSLKDSYKLLGTCQQIELNSFEKDLLLTYNFNLTDIEIFYRAEIHNKLYTCKKYKDTLTNSYTVQLKLNNNYCFYGNINFFFKAKNTLYFVFNYFKVQHEKIIINARMECSINHILPIKETTDVQLININEIQKMLHLIRVYDYVCKRPNKKNKVM